MKSVVVSAVPENVMKPNLTQQQIAEMNVEQCRSRQSDLRVFVDIEKSMNVKHGQGEYEMLDQRIKELQKS